MLKDATDKQSNQLFINQKNQHHENFRQQSNFEQIKKYKRKHLECQKAL